MYLQQNDIELKSEGIQDQIRDQLIPGQLIHSKSNKPNATRRKQLP